MTRRICILMVKGTIVEWQFQEILWPRSHVSVISVKTSYFFFCYSIYCFCFVFSGLAYRSLVSGDNSNRKGIFSKCFPKWRLLITFNPRFRVNRRKRWFSNTVPWCHTSYTTRIMHASSVRECYRISIVF